MGEAPGRERPRQSRTSLPAVTDDRPRKSRMSVPAQPGDRPRKSRSALPAVPPVRPRKSRPSLPAVQVDRPRKSSSALAIADSRPHRPLNSLEEGDGDEGEKTVAGVSLAEIAPQASASLMLKVVAGADLGRQIPIGAAGMLIGRGDGCDFQLQDGAASRRHAELAWTARGLLLRDLGSGNGTKVNDQRIASDSLIQEGDLITIGLTVIEVVDPLKSSAALARRRPPPRGALAFDEEGDEEELDGGVDAQIALRRKVKKPPFQLLLEKLSQLTRRQRIAVGGVFLGIAVVMSGTSLIQTHLENKRQLEIQRRQEAEAQREQQYDLALRDGKKAIHDHRPSDALEKFQEAIALFPDRARDLDRFIATAERDQKAEVQFKKVKALQAAGRFDEALAGLREVDSFSSISELVPPLQQEIEKERLEAQKKEIRQLLEEREIDAAREKIAALPNLEMPIFLDLLEEAAKQAKLEEASSARQARQREQDRKRQAQLRRASEVRQAIDPIVAKIDRADFKGAQRALDKFNTRGKPPHVVSKINLLRKTLPKFQKDYTQGNSQYLGKNYERAAEPLARAWKSWKAMGIEGKLGDKIYAQAAESLENKGRMAMQRKDYVAAGKAFKETLKFNRNSKVASNGLNEIIRKAQDIYLQGYTEMRSNPARARQLFDQVISMTPSDSEVNRNAKNRKRELERGF